VPVADEVTAASVLVTLPLSPAVSVAVAEQVTAASVDDTEPLTEPAAPPVDDSVAASSVRVTVPEAPDASVPVEDNVAEANVLDTLPVAAPPESVPELVRVASESVLVTVPVTPPATGSTSNSSTYQPEGISSASHQANGSRCRSNAPIRAILVAPTFFNRSRNQRPLRIDVLPTRTSVIGTLNNSQMDRRSPSLDPIPNTHVKDLT
jgi:hypothetical protein